MHSAKKKNKMKKNSSCFICLEKRKVYIHLGKNLIGTTTHTHLNPNYTGASQASGEEKILSNKKEEETWPPASEGQVVYRKLILKKERSRCLGHQLMVCRGSMVKYMKYMALSPKYSLSLSLRFKSFKRLIQKLNKPIIPWRIYYKQVSGLVENSSSPPPLHMGKQPRLMSGESSETKWQRWPSSDSRTA